MVDGSYKPSLSGMTCPMLYYITELYYDTIRDAILMCARKPTWVSLIYHTEPTTKKCKTEKLKSKDRYAQILRQYFGTEQPMLCWYVGN